VGRLPLLENYGTGAGGDGFGDLRAGQIDDAERQAKRSGHGDQGGMTIPARYRTKSNRSTTGLSQS